MMHGKWLSPTRHAKVWKPRIRDGSPFDNGWILALYNGNMFGGETYWYPTWDMAMAAIPQLWRH